METLLQQALARAFLHDDPQAFEAGVLTAFALLEQRVGTERLAEVA